MKKCKIEFIKLIGTWPGGSQFVLGEYKVTFEKEIVRLHLKIVAEAPEYKEMGKPRQDEMNPPSDFTRSKEGQEKFFRGKGAKIVIEMLNRLGGIEGIEERECHRIPYSSFITVIIKGIKERKMKKEESLSQDQLRYLRIELIRQDNEIGLNKPIITLRDLLETKDMGQDPQRTKEEKRVLEEGLELPKAYLVVYEKIKDEVKTMGRSKEFEKCVEDILLDVLGSAIQKLKTWWKENKDIKPKEERS